MLRKCSTILLVLAVVAAGRGAQAQDDVPLQVKPGGKPQGGTTIRPVGGNQLPPAPTQNGGGQGGQGGQAGQGGQGGQGGQPEGAGGFEGIYYGGDASVSPDEEQQQTGLHYIGGTAPETHIVRRGDTLWDICYYYFNNPWEWPKIWSYNPSITNPHWIYPGDLVRLFPRLGSSDTVPAPVEPIDTTAPQPIARGASTTVELRQLAFVGIDDLKFAGTVVGSSEEKELLTDGDEVFVEYEAGKPPQVRKRYAIYTEAKEVQHPDNGAVVGSYVLLRGEIEITEVKKGKRARGIITYVTDTIERGMRVGTMRTQFKDVAPRAPDRDLEGVIVALVGPDDLIGERQVVFIDRGADDGVKLGHLFRIVRRGDAWDDEPGPRHNVGDDDRTYPDHSIGELMVVEVGKHTSVAVVTDSKQEAGRGDHVVMRKPKK